MTPTKSLLGFGMICVALGITIGIGMVVFSPTEPAQASNIWDVYRDLSQPSQHIVMTKLDDCLGAFGGFKETDRTQCMAVAEYNIQYYHIIETGRATTDLEHFVVYNQP